VSTNPVQQARQVLTDGVGAAFTGSAVFAILMLVAVVVAVRPWVRRPAATEQSELTTESAPTAEPALAAQPHI
jgi:hypothetical protein